MQGQACIMTLAKSRTCTRPQHGVMLTGKTFTTPSWNSVRTPGARGKIIDLAIYGGSALLLASNFRITTQDVDAVVEGDQGTVTR